MKKFFLALFILALFTSCKPKVPINQEFQDYLTMNSIPFDVKDQQSFNNVIGHTYPHLIGHKVVLGGEHHAISANFDLELALIKYLVQHNNLKYILMEDPLSSTVDYQKYMESGDKQYLYKIHKMFEGTFWWNKERIRFFKRLYNYNRSLNKEEKLQIFGIDYEYDLNYSLEILTNMQEFQQFRFQPQIMNPLSDIQKLTLTNLTNLINICKDMESQYIGSADDNNLDLFKLILNNIIMAKKHSYSGYHGMIYEREPLIYSNFIEIYSKTKNEQKTYFGQWGFMHTLRKTFNYDRWLASRLDSGKDSPLKGEVFCIAYAYPLSQYMGKQWKIKGNSNYYKYSREKTLHYLSLDKNFLLRHDFYAINLDGTNSPYTRAFIHPYFQTNTANPAFRNKDDSLDYFQGLILINGSLPTTPLKCGFNRWIKKD